MTAIDLTRLTEYFPWGEMYADLGFAMPYPEVLMMNDKAYALHAQVTGLLMMQSWGAGNAAGYSTTRAESPREAYTVELMLDLPTLDEAWPVIGIPYETLLRYMTTALLDYVRAVALPQHSFRTVQLAEGRYMFVAEES